MCGEKTMGSNSYELHSSHKRINITMDLLKSILSTDYGDMKLSVGAERQHRVIFSVSFLLSIVTLSWVDFHSIFHVQHLFLPSVVQWLPQEASILLKNRERVKREKQLQ